MSCPSTFPSSCGENHPDPKSGRDLDPDKPGCTMSCREDETNIFLEFYPQLQTFVTNI